jgi:hypothetical protein
MLKMMIKKIFYQLKPIIPRYIQILLRRHLVKKQRVKFQNIWPIDYSANAQPENWKGWPDNKNFAVVLTHDVEKKQGQGKCKMLAELEEKHGFRSSFNFVPERYPDLPQLREYLINKGFEVGVHGLNHDGNLFKTERIFQERALKINKYINEWDALGFRAPAMHHNFEWIHNLNISYDLSSFDTDPFEPQPDGVGTIFPFWISNHSEKCGYVELPYTLVQDFTLFVLMNEKDIRYWKEKIDWIAKHGGMVLVNVHPDYMNFNNEKLKIEKFPAEYYEDLLKYLKDKYHNQYWNALPKDVAYFWYRNFVIK